jgi:hypothetical protein
MGRAVLMKKSATLRLAICAPALALASLVLSPYWLRVLRADSLPRVQLNAESIRPRSIEDLTGKNVARDYAYAWKDLAEAVDKNRASALNGYFTGFAKDALSNRVSDQQRAGIHTRYVDRGHQVSAVFYSADGGEMELIDQAQLETQILEGDKLLHKEDGTQKFVVLMTPGADRWFVRALQPVSDAELRDAPPKK